ncbi:unnamed protein product [Ambrosiozyma monospora]|uniref:Unnamed protein product n=1 Tax=Ambrosiozyma monospora TaxID=43982 RepID=A0ACB5TZR1_AMBMO|nr:unnamed protein product [Ambrosiozyma monospora]
MNFNFHNEMPPLLPFKEIPKVGKKKGEEEKELNQLIFSEAQALLNFHLLKFPEAVSSAVVEAYLFVVAKRGGSSKVYAEEFERLTVFKGEAGETTVTYDEEPSSQQQENIDVKEEATQTKAETEPDAQTPLSTETEPNDSNNMPTPTPLSIPNQLKISRHDNIYLSDRIISKTIFIKTRFHGFQNG